MRFVYSLAMWLAQPILRQKLKRRGAQEPGYQLAVEERFGDYSTPASVWSGLTVWIHAVSLGETRTAALLVLRLRQSLPGMRLLLTHGTATGRAEGARLLQTGDVQVWQPWDTPGAVRRFLEHFKPSVGILMETETWPNLVAVCQQRRVPLVLANARMSEKSRRLSAMLGFLSRPAYGALSAVWAQTEADARRLRSLGATVQEIFGNLKFDAAPDPGQLREGHEWRQSIHRPVAMFASSREGEEALWLGALIAARASALAHHASDGDQGLVAVQWLVVPRHPQRFDAVAALIEQHGFAVSRRSQWRSGPVATSSLPTIWLGDSLGEMALYYGMSDLALLGGSFEPLGGQNLIEAAACGCPVIMGPHTFNFAEAAQLAEAAGAAQRVQDLGQALRVAGQVLAGGPSRAVMVQAALGLSQAHRGAVEKSVAAVQALLRQQDVDAL